MEGFIESNSAEAGAVPWTGSNVQSVSSFLLGTAAIGYLFTGEKGDSREGKGG
jgi:hypothetical protein